MVRGLRLREARAHPWAHLESLERRADGHHGEETNGATCRTCSHRPFGGMAPQQIRATCLYIATKLGDLGRDIVVVGGLIPTLLVPQDSVAERHVGTLDLDLGLALALLDDRRYEDLRTRLRRAGFGPDTNEKGNL